MILEQIKARLERASALSKKPDKFTGIVEQDESATAAAKEQAATVDEVYVAVVQDYMSEGLTLGTGCVQLTKRVQHFGCTAHVLGGLNSERGNPVYAIIGPTKGSVKNALDVFTGGDSDNIVIVKAPIDN